MPVEVGTWITAASVLLSACIGATTAVISIREQRRIARKRATLDLLSQREWDADYIRAKRQFNVLRDAPTPLDMWAQDEHKDSDQLSIIRNTLNDYELIAIGIREGILDEELYQRWFRSSFLKDFRAAKPFIRKIREKEQTNRIFAEMEWLADRWDTTP